jgi:iron complex transport system permease protein
MVSILKKKEDSHTSVLAVLLLTMLVTLGFYASSIGQYPIGFKEVLDTAGFKLGVISEAPHPTTLLILEEVRLPRILASMLVGSVLAAAGSVFQGMFRNPLVSPDILGVSTGAGLGAAAGILFSLSIIHIQLLAFVGGLCTVGAVYLIAISIRQHEPTLILVLAGIVIGSLAGACLSLVKILADPYDQLPAITFWLLGSFASVDKSDLIGALPLCVFALIPLILLRWRINVLSLGDEEARSLGINPDRVRVTLITAATLMTAAAVAIAGVIGWVGLVVPHIARLLVGPNFQRLLPIAMLVGANFMLLVDTLARSLTQTETPIGILTAFVGAPVFVWLLFNARRSWT